MRGAKYFHHVTVIFWAILLAFSLLTVLGKTVLFSHLFMLDNINAAVDIAFLVLVGIFVLLLARLFAPPKTVVMKIIALLVPAVLFLAFLLLSF